MESSRNASGDAWLWQVLEAGALYSVFQPIVDIATGRAFGHEALLRARHPQTGEEIGAGEILAACERQGLHHVLDQRARLAAISGAAALRAVVEPESRFFINFMPNAIYSPDICLRTTMEAIQSVEMDPDRFVFEIVETQQIPDLPHLSRILDYYRSKGVRTAVDDMGAGYTSVEYIVSLQPDYVKFDSSTLIEAKKRPDGMKDLTAIIQTIQRLGCTVIVEGIETPEQLRECRNMRVDYVQGYLLGRPARIPKTQFSPEWYA